jgi:anthranilate/para-aminobenzoate synthase component I
MPEKIEVRREHWTWTPLEAFRAWPRTRPVVVLGSCPSGEPGELSNERARWSYLAEPERVVTIDLNDPRPLERMEAELASTKVIHGDSGPAPFSGGWVVALSYELGSRLEPAVGPASPAADWPWAITMWRCPEVLAFDHARGEWWRIGRANHKSGASQPVGLDEEQREPCKLGEVAPLSTRAAYERAVARGVEYTHAGDVFQVNLAHQLGATFSGSSRSLFASLASTSGPWYGAYLEHAQDESAHAAISLSPELFLEMDAGSRTVTTRPIKGTRRGEADPRLLRDSAKDQAELHMIVDLMRNDLGRVCEAGSVRVLDARTIERHGGSRGGVQHGVATVQGRLRSGESVADLLRATFPAGSITGAPKIRAMQIIRELESRPRGLYTGAIGYISDCGNVSLNVAIRTAVVHGHRALPETRLDEVVRGALIYGAGAGIVADSVPALEWQETLDKARVISEGLPVAPAVKTKRREVQGAGA